MTSRLLKKRPITLPSAVAANQVNSHARHLWVVGAITIGLLLVSFSAFADEPVRYVTAKATTIDGDAEPRRIAPMAAPIDEAFAKREANNSSKLQWRPSRRVKSTAAKSSAAGHTRLIAHEEMKPEPVAAAPQLISANELPSPARLVQADSVDDPLNSDPFEDPFGDNSRDPQPRPIEELESDLPERERFTPLEDDPAPPMEDTPSPALDEPTSADPSEQPEPFDDPFGNDPESAEPRPMREPRPLPQVDNNDSAAMQTDCHNSAEDLNRALAAIDIGIRQKGVEGKDYPLACTLDHGEFEGRHWSCMNFTWTASGLCHKPLYFEQVNLERYGHSVGPIGQPVLSAAHFFLTVPVLPYKMGVHPPNECIYALGYYRPGDCAPYFIPPIPISARGALFQAGAIVGVVAALP